MSFYLCLNPRWLHPWLLLPLKRESLSSQKLLCLRYFWQNIWSRSWTNYSALSLSHLRSFGFLGTLGTLGSLCSLCSLCSPCCYLPLCWSPCWEDSQSQRLMSLRNHLIHQSTRPINWTDQCLQVWQHGYPCCCCHDHQRHHQRRSHDLRQPVQQLLLYHYSP